MEALSSEYVDEYYKVIYDKVNNLMRRDTWEIFPRKLVYNHNFLPLTWSVKYHRKHTWNILIFDIK